jgi:hypothetical protein
MRVSGGEAVRPNGDYLAVGFIADPNDLPPDSPRAELDDDELDFLDGIDPHGHEGWDDDVEAVEHAPRRASSGASRDGAVHARGRRRWPSAPAGCSPMSRAASTSAAPMYEGGRAGQCC